VSGGAGSVTVSPVKRSIERELKLRVPDGFELPALGEPLETRVFTSTYHDTPDLRLCRAGVTLRYRLEGGRGVWQLKLPHGASRVELELAGAPGSPPAELLRLLTALRRGGRLRSVARLRTRRDARRLADDGRALAEIVLDSVAVMERRRVTDTFEEVEIELIEGDEDDLRKIERNLRKAGARKRETRPKIVQVLALRENGAAPDEPATVEGMLRRMFALELERILAHDPGTRLGADPEDVHQHRVALRRLRAFLRAARPLLDRDWADSLRGELSWVAGALGPVRDSDVLLHHLEEEACSLEPDERGALRELVGRIEADRAEARTALLAVLESDRYLALLDTLEGAANDPHLVAGEAEAKGLWRRDSKRLHKAVARTGPDAGDEELHAARIRAKRARYVAELAAPLAGKQATRAAKRAERVQDALGEHQDAVVAEQRIRALLRSSRAPSVHFAGGRLVERQQARRRTARAAYADAIARLVDGKR
jgi:CHAD domain-containing protein